jgi:hypothetical protein
MSASVPVYVQVTRIVTEWVEVQADTLDEAVSKAIDVPGVVSVVHAQYDQPDELL